MPMILVGCYRRIETLKNVSGEEYLLKYHFKKLFELVEIQRISLKTDIML